MAVCATLGSADGYVLQPSGEGSVGFWDDATFDVLAPYLNDEAAGLEVDPYDGGRFAGAALLQIARNMERAILDLHSQPDEWVVRTDNWEQGGKAYSMVHRASRERVLSVAHGVKRVAEEAYSRGLRLLFIGD
jgi:broad specificity phosphatase PhoE